MGEIINAHKTSAGKREGKKLLVRPRRRWEDIRRDVRRAGVVQSI
jgi:hypothetical protein